jgi:hypothetical protein
MIFTYTVPFHRNRNAGGNMYGKLVHILLWQVGPASKKCFAKLDFKAKRSESRLDCS